MTVIENPSVKNKTEAKSKFLFILKPPKIICFKLLALAFIYLYDTDRETLRYIL